jgi:hypothetical protein
MFLASGGNLKHKTLEPGDRYQLLNRLRSTFTAFGPKAIIVLLKNSSSKMNSHCVAIQGGYEQKLGND